jgi:hypothetical protein
MIVECKICTMFGVSNCFFLIQEVPFVWISYSSSLLFFNLPLFSDQKVEILQCNLCKRTRIAMSGSGNQSAYPSHSE